MRHFGFILCILGLASAACNLTSAQMAPTLPVSVSAPTALPILTALPTNTAVPTAVAPTSCALHASWPIYLVVRGDTLSDVAVRTGSTVNDLLQANCLSDPNSITTGQKLHVPTAPQSTTASIGQLSIRPAGSTPGQPGLLVVQPGSNVTLRLDGLQNITSVQFVVPPPGWNGNGFQKTAPMRVLDGASEYTLTIPIDKPGRDFYVHAEATTEDRRVLMSNIVHAGIPAAAAVAGSLTISPSSPTPGHPEIVIVAPGSTVTLRLEGMRNVTSVQFVIPPPGWNGNGFVKTDPVPIQNGVALYTLTIPTDKPRAEFYFSAEVVGTQGEHLTSGTVRAMIAEN